ncbi:MaoC family dehydratase [Hujiaoplasma nucleasis]|uniref:MaoC family dehydratase n=1 Tax=Hujiaoplasma nucleasis TaxID=2725268 RepID=UPI00289A2AFB|nr:MaoC family dehydratase [Hujiaoplasma nucleasis]
MNQLTIQQIKVGDFASTKKVFLEEDVLKFAEVSTDYNPAHVDKEYPKQTMFKKQIVHGMLVGSLFSAIFGVQLPGLGSIYTKQSLKFTRPVYFGDEIEATCSVKEIIVDRNRVIFDCVAKNQNGEVVIVGESEIMPPRETKNA